MQKFLERLVRVIKGKWKLNFNEYKIIALLVYNSLNIFLPFDDIIYVFWISVLFIPISLRLCTLMSGKTNSLLIVFLLHIPHNTEDRKKPKTAAILIVNDCYFDIQR